MLSVRGPARIPVTAALGLYRAFARNTPASSV